MKLCYINPIMNMLFKIGWSWTLF